MSTDLKHAKDEDFKEILSEFVGDHMGTWGIGAITAELHNLAADLLSDSQDQEFINGAIESFTSRANDF